MWAITPHGMAEVAARTAIVYLLLLVLIRLAGKREIGQLTPFDLVVLLLVSNAVQNAMTGPDTTVTGGIVAAVTLIGVNYVVALGRQRWRGLRRFVEGIPVVLISNGQVQYRALSREHLTMTDLMAALREHEVSDVTKCHLAMLEIDGSISVLRQEGNDPTVLRHTRRPFRHHHRSPND